MTQKNTSLASALLGFTVLFILYHAAEYMIVFKNSPIGFLSFQGLFFITAWLIAQWQFGQGLSAWGFIKSRQIVFQILIGLLIGTLIYGLTFLISLKISIEKIIEIPDSSTIMQMFGLFVFGNFFSSFSEDILTRGYLYKHLKPQFSVSALILLSAAVYVFNHVYRLTNGIETYIYLFLLGVLFMIPLVKTGQIWTTGSIHWAGNCTFYLTHEVFKTETGSFTSISSNYILSGVLGLVIIGFIIFYRKKEGKNI